MTKGCPDKTFHHWTIYSVEDGSSLCTVNGVSLRHMTICQNQLEVNGKSFSVAWSNSSHNFQVFVRLTAPLTHQWVWGLPPDFLQREKRSLPTSHRKKLLEQGPFRFYAPSSGSRTITFLTFHSYDRLAVFAFSWHKWTCPQLFFIC